MNPDAIWRTTSPSTEKIAIHCIHPESSVHPSAAACGPDGGKQKRRSRTWMRRAQLRHETATLMTMDHARCDLSRRASSESVALAIPFFYALNLKQPTMLPRAAKTVAQWDAIVRDVDDDDGDDADDRDGSLSLALLRENARNAIHVLSRMIPDERVPPDVRDAHAKALLHDAVDISREGRGAGGSQRARS